MNDSLPLLTPDDYIVVTAETGATPELEPGGTMESTEELDLIVPDIEPPTIQALGGEDSFGGEGESTIVAPEFSPDEVAGASTDEVEFIGPEDLPPQIE